MFFYTESTEMKLSANLPDEISSLTYTKNHHYIELKDVNGKKTKLIPNDLIKCECKGCKFVFYSESNHGITKCPICGGKIVTAWGKVQLCFVPEKETDFLAPPKKDPDKDD